MGFTFTHLFETGLLTANALCILNEQRFLRQHGIDDPRQASGIKEQIAMFLYAVRNYGKWPIIALNVITIIFEILIG